MVHRSSITLIAVLLAAGSAVFAQIDDLAADPWSVPQLDALQTYRDAPLCLHCTSATVLTSLPGIGRTTASRILAAVRRGAATMDALAAEACLSVDQRLILEGASSLVCSCESWFSGIRLRSRLRSEPSTAPDVYGRAELHTSTTRVGVQSRTGPLGDVVGGWAMADLGPVSVAVGDLALRSGLGLVHGGGGAFGRGTLARAASVESTTRLRPWTSSWLDPSQRGAGFVVSETIAGMPIEAGGVWSHRTVGQRLETTYSATTTASIANATLGASIQHLQYDQPLSSTSMLVVPEQGRTLASVHGQVMDGAWSVLTEIAADQQLRTAGLAIARWTYPSGRIVGGVRWAHADLRNPYAAPITSASALGNESGIVFGLHHRAQRWNIEASVDLHQRPSRSWGSPLPSRGIDVLVDAERRLGRGLIVAARGRYEVDTEGWRPTDGAVTAMIERRRATGRAELTAEVHRTLRLRCRADVRWLSADRLRPPEIGGLGYLEARYTPNDAMALAVRHTVYHSESIDTAPYTIEAPLSGLLQIVAGSGRGARTIVSARWHPLPAITLGLLGVSATRNGLPTAFSAALQIDVSVQ